MANALQKFVLGTAVKITTVLNIDTATAATISIEDPCEAYKVSDAAMTKEANGIYSYIYQSASTDEDGDYIITIKVTYAGYIGTVQDKFTLVDQET